MLLREARVTVLLINYADGGYYEAQKLNSKTGLLVGGVDRALQFGRQHLDPTFLKRNGEVLNRQVGAGRWLWKPYVVVKALQHAMADGDILFYADSGSHFVSSVVPIVELCRQQATPILLFTLHPSHVNRMYTKRDCFHFMDMDRPPYPDMTHILASFFVCRKTSATLAFFEEWLRFAEDPRILHGGAEHLRPAQLRGVLRAPLRSEHPEPARAQARDRDDPGYLSMGKFVPPGRDTIEHTRSKA